MNGEAGPKAGPVPLRDQPTMQRLPDADILEIITAVYEWSVWAAEVGLVEFETFSELSLVIAELRRRLAVAA